jgi:hypothetical protein
MRSPMRRQLTRVLVALGLVSALILPAASPVGAADPVVLRVGTVQDLDAMNPYLTEYYVGWEVFGLNYQGLVDFGLNARTATPGRSRSTRTSSGPMARLRPPPTRCGHCRPFSTSRRAIAATSASAISTCTSPTRRSPASVRPTRRPWS